MLSFLRGQIQQLEESRARVLWSSSATAKLSVHNQQGDLYERNEPGRAL